MNTLLTVTDWIGSLNPWQMTLLTTGALAAWLLLMLCVSRFLGGGYPGDRLKRDDEEGGE